MKRALVLTAVIGLLAAGCGGSTSPAEPDVFATPQEVESLLLDSEMDGYAARAYNEVGHVTVSCVSEDDVGRRFSCYSEVVIDRNGYPGQTIPLADYDVTCDSRRCQWDRWSHS